MIQFNPIQFKRIDRYRYDLANGIGWWIDHCAGDNTFDAYLLDLRPSIHLSLKTSMFQSTVLKSQKEKKNNHQTILPLVNVFPDDQVVAISSISHFKQSVK